MCNIPRSQNPPPRRSPRLIRHQPPVFISPDFALAGASACPDAGRDEGSSGCFYGGWILSSIVGSCLVIRFRRGAACCARAAHRAASFDFCVPDVASRGPYTARCTRPLCPIVLRVPHPVYPDEGRERFSRRVGIFPSATSNFPLAAIVHAGPAQTNGAVLADAPLG